MAEITQSQIVSALAAQGTTAATQELILNFLNTAAIRTNDPHRSFGTEFRELGINDSVAQSIIDRRNGLSRFTQLTELANKLDFGEDTFKTLLDTFSRCVTKVSTIRFPSA